VIRDNRSQFYNHESYMFSYSGGHLATVASWIGTSESYTFTYLGGQGVLSPFNSASFGPTTVLQSVGTTGLGIASGFQYNSSAEMTQMTTALGRAAMVVPGVHVRDGDRGAGSVEPDDADVCEWNVFVLAG
jgi:hypothetical protein